MSEILENLNPEQKEAVLHEDGPLLIVAGAGTGKTAVVTKRIAQLITSDKCKPEEVLALTFTEKAAAEMEERVDKLLPYGYVDLWISTFHAFSERILKENGLEIGLPNDFKLLNQTQQWLLVRKNLEKFNLDYYRPLGNPAKFIHALTHHFSRLKDENIAPSDYLKYTEELKLNTDSMDFFHDDLDEETRKKMTKEELKEIASQEIKKQTEAAQAYHIYQNLLLTNNALDFGDLIVYALKLFQERKNVLMKYRKQFKYILVDEFQDTNWAQYELLKLLASPRDNITVVADDDQSVFKWRGASISNILNFKNDYPRTKEVFLTRNYRSKQNILDLSYAFIQQNNPYRLEVKLSSEEKKLSKKLISQNPGQGEISHLHAKTVSQEAKMTAEKIIELFNQSPETDWSDFAVLVRANASAEEFMHVFDQAKIPCSFLASRGLYAKTCVLDILSYLKLLDDYHEGPAMHRILTLPLWQMPHQDVMDLNYFAKRKGYSLYETMKQADALKIKEKEAVKRILSLLERHQQLVREKKNTSEIVQSFLQDSGYLKALVKEESLINQAELNYLNQFYKKITDFEKENPDKTLADFLSLVDLELESGEEGSLEQNLEEGPDTVKILTVHTAKGLEFKYVFVANLVDKKFPSLAKSEAIGIPEKLVKEIMPEGDVHLQEERRLFYVAMTRAKDGLYLTSADDYGGLRKKKLSRFLMELSEKGFKLAEIKEEEIKLEKPKEKKKKTAYPAASSFSFTQLTAYNNCPHQYRFAHILKVPVRGKPSFSYGKTMHAVLQQFFLLIKSREESQQGDLFGKGEVKDLIWEDLSLIYDSCFIDDWYPSRKEKEEYFSKGKKSLKLFFKKWEKEKPRVRSLEYGFNLRIKDEEIFTLKGVIDRVDEVPGGLKLIDYKTGNPKTALDTDDKFQLLIYQMAVEEVLKEKVAGLAFYYLDNGEEISFLGSEKDLEKTREKVVKIIGEIREGEFPPKPGFLCKYCDFYQICEFRG